MYYYSYYVNFVISAAVLFPPDHYGFRCYFCHCCCCCCHCCCRSHRVFVRWSLICFTAALVLGRRFAANNYFVRISRKMATVNLESILPWPEYFRQVLNSTSKDHIRIFFKMSVPAPAARSSRSVIASFVRTRK